MTDERSISDLRSPTERIDVTLPQFRLSQLFVFIAAMAVSLTLSSQSNSFFDRLDSPLVRHFMNGWAVAMAIVSSLAVTVAGYGLYWRRHGGRFLAHPGHWLIFSLAIAGLVGQIQAIGYQQLFKSADAGFPTTAPTKPVLELGGVLVIFAVMSIASLVFHIGLNVYFGRRQFDRHWKSVFYVKAFGPFLWILGQLLYVCWLARAITTDRRAGISRDSVHRLGVAVEVVATLLFMLMSVGSFVVAFQF